MNPEFNPELPSQPWREVIIREFCHREKIFCEKCFTRFPSRKLYKKHLADKHSY